MEHDLFIDGNVKEYSWSIKTGNSIAEQIRKHPSGYLSGGKLQIKNDDESKFVAVHVGIYWGLGVFIIKDFDVVNVMCDSKFMHDVFTQRKKIDNQIINDKIYFINQLTNLRKLKINYQIIKLDCNLATRRLVADEGDKGRNSKNYV